MELLLRVLMLYNRGIRKVPPRRNVTEQKDEEPAPRAAAGFNLTAVATAPTALLYLVGGTGNVNVFLRYSAD